MDERYPSGRRRSPLGVRRGGQEYDRIHERIADAALRALAREGYSDMNVDAISASAGVSKRTVYRHFPTKLDLALAGIGQLSGMFEYVQRETSAKSRLKAYLRSADPRDRLFAPVMATAISHRGSTPELLEALRSEVLLPRQRLLERFIREGQLTGEIKPTVSSEVVAALSTGLYIDDLAGVNQWFGDARRSGRVFAQIWPLLAAD